MTSSDSTDADIADGILDQADKLSMRFVRDAAGLPALTVAVAGMKLAAWALARAHPRSNPDTFGQMVDDAADTLRLAAHDARAAQDAEGVH